MKTQRLSSLPLRFNARALAFLNVPRRGLATFSIPKVVNEPNVSLIHSMEN